LFLQPSVLHQLIEQDPILVIQILGEEKIN